MEDKFIENLKNLIDSDEENKNDYYISDNKSIKSDNSIIERIDKIYITENGKQLLREIY